MIIKQGPENFRIGALLIYTNPGFYICCNVMVRERSF